MTARDTSISPERLVEWSEGWWKALGGHPVNCGCQTCIEHRARLISYILALAENPLPGAALDVVAALMRARQKHGPMHGPHEGYAVILEELDELWDEVKAQTQDKARMRKEALHVAAMALRFVEDVCDASPVPLAVVKG